MVDFLGQLSVERLAILCGVLAVFFVVLLVPLISIIARNWRKYRESQLATSVILEMLDRGMEPDEITRVLQAAALPSDDDPQSPQETRQEIPAAGV